MAILDNIRAWPEFDCHKIVRAAPIVAIAEMTGPGTCRVLFVNPFDDGKVEPFVATESVITDRAEVGDYAVVYTDNYKSISPKAQFLSGYSKRGAIA